MEQGADLNTAYKKLQDEINNNNSEQVFKLTEKILAKQNDKEVQMIQLISLIKLERFQQIEQLFQKNPPNNPDQHYLNAYSLYKNNKNEELLKYLQKNSFNELRFNTLKAQAYFRLEQYENSCQQYLTILKGGQLTKEEQNDVNVNMLAALCHQSKTQQIIINKDGMEVEGEEQKNQKQSGFNSYLQISEKFYSENNFTREFLFNLGVLYSNLYKFEQAKNILLRYEKMLGTELKSEEDQEDFIMQNVQKDYIWSIQFDFNHEMVDKKLKIYQDEYKKINFGSSNLKAVINNNIVSLRGMHKNEHYTESMKLLDEALNGKFKQTQDQILALKLNKLLLYINRGKVNETQNLLKDIEQNYQQDFLLLNPQFVKIKIGVLLKNENIQELDAFIELITKFSQNQKNQNYKFIIFLVVSEVSRIRNEQQQIIKSFLRICENDNRVYDNELLCCFIFSILSKDKKLLESSHQIVDEIRKKTNDIQVLRALGDIYQNNKELDKAIEIYEKILTKVPQSQKYKVKLAEFYAKTNPQKAENLLKDIQNEELIDDFKELNKLESDIALSKMKQTDEKKSPSPLLPLKEKGESITKKIQKKKKKSIKLPKNFDPTNPGPLPNPERWLPKWERKEWKKKKGIKSRTQGSSNVTQNTKENFQNAQSTANQDVNFKKTDKRNKKKKK